MLNNWLEPVHLSLPDPSAPCFGNHLNTYRHNSGFPDLSHTQVALLGTSAADTNPIRRALYDLAPPTEGIHIADIGNLRKPNLDMLIPVFTELLQARIFPILLATDHALTYAQFQAYEPLQQLVNLAVIDKTADFSPDKKQPTANSLFLNNILKRENNHLLHFTLLGYQSHSVPTDVLQWLANHHYDYYRLGYLRAHLEEAEPLLRDADLLSINLAAVRYAESPAHPAASPSGFFAEEICKMAHYAGMSDQLSSVGFYGYHAALDQRGQSAQLVAQMIWYLLDGLASRKGDYPISSDGLTEYVVHFKNSNVQVTFWKSKRSDRWWMQVPVKHKQQERHRLVPCSYADYVMACQGDLPERLVRAYDRFL